MSKVDMVKSLLTASNGQFVSVTFRKVDGSLRTIVHNPKVTKGIKGDQASPSAKQAAATRKKNNPHLVSVFDSKLSLAGTPAEKCWRSINCETVLSIRTGGQEIVFSG